MRNFEELPVVPPGPVWRSTGETGYVGTQTLKELIASGEIKPVMTKSGRLMLSIADARKLYDALCAGRDHDFGETSAEQRVTKKRTS
jgi:hypothetical protein